MALIVHFFAVESRGAERDLPHAQERVIMERVGTIEIPDDCGGAYVGSQQMVYD